MSWLGGAISAIGSIAGSWLGAKSSEKIASSSNKSRAELAAAADARALSNAKELFRHQNSQGPQQSVAGYRRAGINPILVGDFNPSMPSFSSHVPDVESPDVGRYYAQAGNSISNALQMFLEDKERQSRIALNSSNADAVTERVETQKRLADAEIDLKSAQAATEAEMPRKRREEIFKSVSERMINDSRKRLIDSQINVNAAQLDKIASDIEIARKTLELNSRSKDFIGLPFGTAKLHFSREDIADELANLVLTLGGKAEYQHRTKSTNKKLEKDRKIIQKHLRRSGVAPSYGHFFE